MKDIVGKFASLGRLVDASGNRPLVLNDEQKVWLVEQMHVDVFAVVFNDGAVSGIRQHIFRAFAGEMLFGLKESADEGNIVFLAAGSTGTQIREMTRGEWYSAAAAEPEVLEDMVASWTRNLQSGIGRKERIPRKLEVISEAAELPVEEGACAGIEKGFAWVRCTKGAASFMGRADWPAVKEGMRLAITEDAWVEAKEDCAFVLEPQQGISSAKNFWQLLDKLHVYLRCCAVANRARSEEEEKERIDRRVKLDRGMLGNALSRLGFILERKKKGVTMQLNAEYPLYAAASMVGSAVGLEVKQPKVKSGRHGSGESLDDISRMSRFRTREVMLSGDWYKRDCGPILAFMEIDEEKTRPVALIPVTARSYDLYDSVKGTKTRVDEAVADRLKPKAQSFYRALPDRKLTGKDLFMFAMQGCWKDVGTVFTVGICGALLNLVTPWMTGILFSSIIPEAERGQLLQMGGILLTCAIAVAMFDITKGIALLRVEGRSDGALQAAITDRMLSLPVPFFSDYTSGDLASRLMGVSRIRMILSGVTVNSVLSFIFASFNLFLLFFYSTSLAWFGIALSAIGLFIVIGASTVQVKYQRQIVDMEGRISGMVLQFINGIAKLRVSGTEDRAFSKWASDFGEKKKLAFKGETASNVTSTFTSSYPILTLMAIFMWMMWKLKGELSIGHFIAFNAAYVSFQAAMLQMSDVITTSLNIFPLYDRMRPVVENVPEVDESKKSPGELSGAIEINHVNFRYDPEGQLILKDVSMSIEPGEFIAIVGGSGSGKSTLMRLLLGFETAESGTIYYDGQDLSSVDILEVRRQLGVVLQNGSLMQGDIKSNILGSSMLSIDSAWEAAGMVGVEKDIKEMPMGMHTVIPAGGGGLSGGQRQRLIIARAIVRRPRILFFDEATSALDNKTQSIVSRSLEGLHVTRIVIAHRLSTIINADRIYVLQKGEITESGSYDELMRQDGFFAELAKRQIA